MSAGEINGDGRRPIMAVFDHGAHPRTASGARLCPTKWDQPQQLRKTSLLKYAWCAELFHVLRLVLCTQPRSNPVAFGGSARMRPNHAGGDASLFKTT